VTPPPSPTILEEEVATLEARVDQLNQLRSEAMSLLTALRSEVNAVRSRVRSGSVRFDELTKMLAMVEQIYTKLVDSSSK
jgi:hypothetical protein